MGAARNRLFLAADAQEALTENSDRPPARIDGRKHTIKSRVNFTFCANSARQIHESVIATRPNAEAKLTSLSIVGAALVGLLFCGGCATGAQHLAVHEISPGISTGKKPWTQADFDALRAHHIRTILSLENMPWDVWPECWQARRNGIKYRDVPILAAPLPPSEKRVKQALLLLNDPSLRPIFVHCFLGEDRSTFIMGLYRVYFQGWTPQAAWKEMLDSDFHAVFRLRGLSSYYWRHTAEPEWAKPARSPP